MIVGGYLEVNSYLKIPNRIEKTKLSPKDIIDLSKLPELYINFISCVVDNHEHLQDIHDLIIDEHKKYIKIYSKIESEKGIINFDNILNYSDGIIIELGSITSLPIEEVNNIIIFRYI